MKQHILIRSLFEKYQTDVLRFVRAKFGNCQDAEDIVQDTFYNVLRRENFDGLENPQAYIYKTANNLALNRIRSQAQHNNYLKSLQPEDDIDSFERSIFALQDLENIHDALARFPKKYRTTFVMSRVQNKTYSEISQELGISVSTVEKHIIKVLQHLRAKIKESSAS